MYPKMLNVVAELIPDLALCVFLIAGIQCGELQ